MSSSADPVVEVAEDVVVGNVVRKALSNKERKQKLRDKL